MFTWIYLLKKRSEVYQVFLNFQQLVEWKFGRKIITMQINCGRVVNMKSYMVSFKKLASHIMFHVLMPINRTVLLNANNVTLMMWTLLWLRMHPWWPTSIGDRNSLRGKYYPNLLIRHKGSQRIYVSLNRWVVNSPAPGNSLTRSGLSVATVL
jgi:hypothetical protein